MEAVWRNGEDSDIMQKIEKCSKDLEWWEKKVFGNVRRELEEKKKMLAKIEAETMRRGDNSQLRELKVEIHDLMDKETRMWSRRSKVLWLKNGDRNSKIFHKKTTQRFKKNSILGIEDKRGYWQEQPEVIEDIIVEYFAELFTTRNSVIEEGSLSFIPRLVTDEINEKLMGEFMEWEIQKALDQMAPLKAPGPDRMPPLFYQHFWGIMNREVTSTILAWLNSGKLPYPVNHTFVTLIPKVKNLVSVSQYRPISLCNVLYKIFSKVLANKLKKFMLDLITEHQSTFAKNRLISDNVLVAFETLHCMKSHNLGQTGFMALKLDMSKAYDRVEWNYLQKLMEKMGFCSRWISLSMECIRTISYSILVNDDPKGLINPT